MISVIFFGGSTRYISFTYLSHFSIGMGLRIFMYSFLHSFSRITCTISFSLAGRVAPFWYTAYHTPSTFICPIIGFDFRHPICWLDCRSMMSVALIFYVLICIINIKNMVYIILFNFFNNKKTTSNYFIKNSIFLYKIILIKKRINKLIFFLIVT